MVGRQAAVRSAAVVEEMWDEIERAVCSITFVPGAMRIYQDGLPVCAHVQEIVSSLAEAGSRNHRLLLHLQARGAILMGTESPDLLVEEYQIAVSSFTSGRASGAQSRQDQMRAALLERRDRYIAERIDQTMSESESGILFIGVLHAPAKYLPPDIQVIRALSSARQEGVINRGGDPGPSPHRR
jgi:hypothetical protein